MKTDATPASLQLREAISANLAQVHVILERYGARNPRVFGSVVRGDATSASDVDLLVDLNVGGNPLLRVAGMSEELSDLWVSGSTWSATRCCANPCPRPCALTSSLCDSGSRAASR